MRNRFIIACAGIALAMIAAIILSKLEPIRSWRITQTKPLVDGISMRVEDVYLFPAGTNTLFRIRCRYLGGDPNENYFLKASILSASEPSETISKVMWQAGLADDGRGGFPKIWEFLPAPSEGTSRFVLRIYCRGKTPDAKEQFVDFRIPYLPKVKPNG